MWFGNSLSVQWLELSISLLRAWGLIPGKETKIPQAVSHSQKEKTGFLLKINIQKAHKL